MARCLERVEEKYTGETSRSLQNCNETLRGHYDIIFSKDNGKGDGMAVGNGYRILVLEDEISMNRGIAFSAERIGFEVIRCETVAEAQKAAAGGGADIMICDISLPDGSGLDFIRSIREGQQDKRPYIICLTVLDTENDHVLGYEAGADDYIVKPFSLSVLMLKLEAFVKRNKGAAEHRTGSADSTGANTRSGDIVSGALRFSPERMEASLDGEPVQLTRNEYRLLSVFLRNPGQVLSKEQLLMQAFDIYGDFVDENTLAVNISRLREKLRDDAQDPVYIRNVRGLGYIWMKKLQ